MGEDEKSMGGKAIGGGGIGVEISWGIPPLAHVSAKMKTLHLLQAKSLPNLNKEGRKEMYISKILYQKCMRERGIDFHVSISVRSLISDLIRGGRSKWCAIFLSHITAIVTSHGYNQVICRWLSTLEPLARLFLLSSRHVLPRLWQIFCLESWRNLYIWFIFSLTRSSTSVLCPNIQTR